MKFRSLDGTGDWNFGRGLESYATNNNAIAFDIQTSILSWYRDCWFDPAAGLDWFTLLGTPSTQDRLILNVRGVILQVNGVKKVNSISPSLNGRKLTLSINVDTIFSNNQTQIVEVP